MQLKEAAFSVARGNLELTPYGMRLRVKDFSPFVVSWNAPGGAAVPSTGDSFPMGAALLCMLLALAGAGWLMRRMRRV